MKRRVGRRNRWLVALSLLILSACASIDFDYPRTESFAVKDTATAETRLGVYVTPLAESAVPGTSGFYPMSSGIDALSMRLMLADRADRTIDAQYYLIKNDLVGRTFVRSLLRAADRGVRVRLLLDDVFTSGYDTGMMALNSHPNFEIRIYNPFNRGAMGRSLGAVTSLSRVNRRMHNKTFTVDNQVTIIGGRNIADEYFGAREDAKFGDLDVVGIGPIAQDVSRMFDTYWNHQTALPVPAFLAELEDPQRELERLRASLEESFQAASESRYADAVRDQFLEQIETDPSVFSWASYQLVYDTPDKGIKGKASDADLIVMPLRESLFAAEKEVLIASPYFVPRKRGIEQLSALQASGVEVAVITNSLAANNQATVHGGYAPARKPLLKNGITLYEVRPDSEVAGTEYVDSREARATLHTKAYVVDREHVFIGSFNFDPRSANLNTELGVIIHDTGLAEHLLERARTFIPTQTWEVFLNEDGQIRWRGMDGTQTVIYKKEPQTTWGQRFTAGLYRMLPIRSQL